jgi:hypothetical protein
MGKNWRESRNPPATAAPQAARQRWTEWASAHAGKLALALVILETVRVTS